MNSVDGGKHSGEEQSAQLPCWGAPSGENANTSTVQRIGTKYGVQNTET